MTMNRICLLRMGLWFGVLLVCVSMPWHGARAKSASVGTSLDCKVQSVAHAVTMGDAARAVACTSRAHTLLLVGDIHGTKQMPAFVVQLVRDVSASRPVVLGLEMPVIMQHRLDVYMQSDGGPAARAELLKSVFWKLNDGRESRAMLNLVDRIRSMREQGRSIDVFAMAPVPENKAQIDKAGGFLAFKESGIADLLRARLKNRSGKSLLIAYMGNWHTRYMAKMEGMTLSVTDRMAMDHPVLVDPAGYGKAWTCMQGDCGIHTIGRASLLQGKPRLWRTPDPTGRVVHLHLRFPEFTGSLPALPKSK